jgi:hypothetical protein
MKRNHESQWVRASGDPTATRAKTEMTRPGPWRPPRTLPPRAPGAARGRGTLTKPGGVDLSIFGPFDYDFVL